MGRDKASLPFGAETLLERVLRSVATVTSEVVVAGAPAQVMPPGIRVSADTWPGDGPLPALLDASVLERSRVEHAQLGARVCPAANVPTRCDRGIAPCAERHAVHACAAPRARC